LHNQFGCFSILSWDSIKGMGGRGQLGYYPDGERRRWEIGFTVHCLVGVNAAIDLFELADFLLGWFGLDIAKDDKPPPEPEEETIKEPTKEP